MVFPLLLKKERKEGIKGVTRNTSVMYSHPQGVTSHLLEDAATFPTRPPRRTEGLQDCGHGLQLLSEFRDSAWESTTMLLPKTPHWGRRSVGDYTHVHSTWPRNPESLWRKRFRDKLLRWLKSSHGCVTCHGIAVSWLLPADGDKHGGQVPSGCETTLSHTFPSVSRGWS